MTNGRSAHIALILVPVAVVAVDQRDADAIGEQAIGRVLRDTLGTDRVVDVPHAAVDGGVTRAVVGDPGSLNAALTQSDGPRFGANLRMLATVRPTVERLNGLR